LNLFDLESRSQTVTGYDATSLVNAVNHQTKYKIIPFVERGPQKLGSKNVEIGTL
jgi:hypothetical protein